MVGFKVFGEEWEEAEELETALAGPSCYMCYLFPLQPTTKKGKFKRKKRFLILNSPRKPVKNTILNPPVILATVAVLYLAARILPKLISG